MPHGRRTERTVSVFAGVLTLVALTMTTGCQRLSGSRVQPIELSTAPITPARPETTTANPDAGSRRAPGALVDPPRSAPDSLAQRPPAPSTPLLDAALRRAKAMQEDARPDPVADNPPQSTTIEPFRAGKSVTVSDRGNGPESGVGLESGAKPEASPRPTAEIDLIPGTTSTPPVARSSDAKVKPTASTVPERVVDREGASRPINPEGPVGPARPRDPWREGLDRLRSVARDRAAVSGGDPDGRWAIRVRLLGTIGEPESPSGEGELMRPVLAALAATTASATGTSTANEQDQSATIRAAVDALEAHAPLEISELQLCRKVKGFADFEPIEAADCRAGHGVIVYCEMAGLRYEPEGRLHRSRLKTRVELVPAGGSEPAWTHPLGTVEDLCRRRRRDYYINYRISLPGSLAPGSYELRLVQDDLVANRSATRGIALSIQP